MLWDTDFLKYVFLTETQNITSSTLWHNQLSFPRNTDCYKDIGNFDDQDPIVPLLPGKFNLPYWLFPQCLKLIWVGITKVGFRKVSAL